MCPHSTSLSYFLFSLPRLIFGLSVFAQTFYSSLLHECTQKHVRVCDCVNGSVRMRAF